MHYRRVDCESALVPTGERRSTTCDRAWAKPMSVGDAFTMAIYKCTPWSVIMTGAVYVLRFGRSASYLFGDAKNPLVQRA